MELKVNKGLDPYNCSIEELKKAINNCIVVSDDKNNQQMAAKLEINSIYGCLANQYYSLSNVDIAESITLQGQDLIKYATGVVDYFFKNQWHEDYALHKKIANEILKINPSYNVEEFLNLCKHKLSIPTTMQVAGDTDSSYISFESLVNSLNIPLEFETKFLIILYDNFLEDHLTKCFDDYANKFNCPESLEEFALEKIFKSGIFTAKKHYAGDICWKEPGIFVDPLHKVTIKGLEAIQGSTPKFCRDAMKEFINMMLTHTNNKTRPEYKDIVAWFVKKKAEFAMQNPENICKSFNVNDYEKYIYEDKQALVFTDETCPAHVRGAAIYNNMLFNKAKKWKGKYNLIQKGDKVKFYYVKDNYKKKSDLDPVFAYLPNNFPIEFAPEIDIDKMFEKLLLDPLNRIVESCGFNPIPSTLTYSNALF